MHAHPVARGRDRRRSALVTPWEPEASRCCGGQRGSRRRGSERGVPAEATSPASSCRERTPQPDRGRLRGGEEPDRLHRPWLLPRTLPPGRSGRAATSRTRSAEPRVGSGSSSCRRCTSTASSHALGHSTVRARRPAREADGDGHGVAPSRREGRPAAQPLRGPVPLRRARELRAALGHGRPRQRRGEAAHRMSPAEIEEVLDGFAATAADSASRPASTGSSCTAPTATCCSSPSARGATRATTNGASRVPSRER